jgi:choline-glycine betaine transporter
LWTVAGVCTSLGLGAIQLVAGFQFLGWVSEDASEEKIDTTRNLTIWGITIIATISVMSGLHAGVKLLSFTAFLLGMFLMVMVFILDDTKFLLNLNIQEIGYFMQHSLIELNFWTDAFGQLRDGGGRASDGNAPALWWMDAWMVFYQAWWVSWSAFVGLFVARISKGRTIGEVILYSLLAPILYCIVWFSIWGGVGLRQARQADGSHGHQHTSTTPRVRQ